MKRRFQEAVLYQVFAECDCGGIMVWDGRELTSYPPQYPHTCEECGKSESLGKIYPRHEAKGE